MSVKDGAITLMLDKVWLTVTLTVLVIAWPPALAMVAVKV